MGIFSWIILGLVAGTLAKLIMPGRDPGGFFVTILIGIAGAFIGGYVGALFGFGGVSDFSLGSVGTAIIGALILLFLFRLVKK